MNSKHLTTGSANPPIQEGKVRIYNMRFCPYAQRSILVALAKEIPLDVVNVNLKQKPEWLFDKNPEGKVPTIETPQGNLYESLLVSDYFDEIYPKRPLHPKDPYQKTLDRIWIENASKVITPYYKALFGGGVDEEATRKNILQMAEGLELFENELRRRGTLFFCGNDAPGMLDYMFWPWMERIPTLKILYPKLYDFDAARERNNALEKWRQAMKNDAAVKAYFITPEQHVQFVKSHLDGTPNYEILNA